MNIGVKPWLGIIALVPLAIMAPRTDQRENHSAKPGRRDLYFSAYNAGKARETHSAKPGHRDGPRNGIPPAIRIAPPALAVGSHPMFPSIRRAVAELGSSRWRVRSRAQRRLLGRGPRVLPAVLARLRRARSPEVINRLVHVGIQLYLEKFNAAISGRRPFLGITFAVRPLTIRKGGREKKIAAAVVRQVWPGFPCGRFLHAGDLIIAVNSDYLPKNATVRDFRNIILHFHPGAQIALTVRRTGQEHVYRVRLMGVPGNRISLADMLQQRSIRVARFLRKYLSGVPPGR